MHLPETADLSHTAPARRTLYLCPSDRAARAFHALLSRQSIAPPDCIDIERFSRELWQRGQLYGLIDDARELLDPLLTQALWRQAVAQEAALSGPEVARIAALYAEAWQLAHRYQMPMSQLLHLAAGSDNLALFARAATLMQRLLKARVGITQAELPRAVAARLDALRALLPARVVLVPAFATNASHNLLLNGMRGRGTSFETWQSDAACSVEPVAHLFSDETQEMNAAIKWAKAQVSEPSTDARSVVAIVVPNLSSKRSVWLTALRAALNPDSWWLDPETDRNCFNVSVG